MASQVTGVKRIVLATKYSFAGLSAAWKNEAAFRQELILCILLIPAAFWLGRNALEVALLLGTLFTVLITELVNSAIEAIIDRISVERHPLSGRAKDLGSAAVFMSLLMVICVWGLIAYERFHIA
ncbi:MAG: diacylglycerol kinase [Pseudomonadota bacterium]